MAIDRDTNLALKLMLGRVQEAKTATAIIEKQPYVELPRGVTPSGLTQRSDT
jgi:hypothetical protein